MSIRGTAATNDFSGGAHIDFDVGTSGLADLYKSGFTVAVLAKTSSDSRGFFGGYTDNTAGTPTGQFFLSNNSGGRMFGNSDFSSGFPDSGTDADGINDNVWRWHVMSKATGSAHYKFSYADLATLTWVDGESTGSANHSDNATTSGFFSTWAVYGMGSNAGDFAAIVAWSSQLTPTQIHASCTQAAADLISQVNPKAGWLFPQATSGSTILDFTGGGADEVSRPNITTSTDPVDFNFAFPSVVALTPAAMTLSPVANTPTPQAVHVPLEPASITYVPQSATPVPGVVNVSLTPASIVLTPTRIGNLPVSRSFSIVYNTEITISKSVSIVYGVRSEVSNSVSIVYGVRRIMPQGKVATIVYGVRKTLSRSYSLVYGVRIPVAPAKSVEIDYSVRSTVSRSFSIVYDTDVIGSGTVSRSFEIVYHTLATPTVEKVITRPIEVDNVPPQVVTTSFR